VSTPSRAVETAALLKVAGDAGVASVVSEAARGGAVWWALSGVLALLGGRWRRAAVDGLAGWAAGEAVAAGLKRVVGRRRPVLAGRGIAPMSSSMPSAHTAAAVAYATAAGVAAPALAVPLVATAGVVGWSRLATRRHFPTDVATAAAVGLATGAVVAAVAARVRSGRTPTDQHDERSPGYTS
jgi:membrane-associated phospholipid phosphatase